MSPKWRIESSDVISGEGAAEAIGHGIFDRDEDTNDFGSGCPFWDDTTDHGFRQTDGAVFLKLGEQTVRVPDHVNSTSWAVHVAVMTFNSTATSFLGEVKMVTPWGDSNVVTVAADATVRTADLFKVLDSDRSGTWILLEIFLRRLGTGAQFAVSSRYNLATLWWVKT